MRQRMQDPEPRQPSANAHADEQNDIVNSLSQLCISADDREKCPQQDEGSCDAPKVASTLGCVAEAGVADIPEREERPGIVHHPAPVSQADLAFDATRLCDAHDDRAPLAQLEGEATAGVASLAQEADAQPPRGLSSAIVTHRRHTKHIVSWSASSFPYVVFSHPQAPLYSCLSTYPTLAMKRALGKRRSYKCKTPSRPLRHRLVRPLLLSVATSTSEIYIHGGNTPGRTDKARKTGTCCSTWARRRASVGFRLRGCCTVGAHRGLARSLRQLENTYVATCRRLSPYVCCHTPQGAHRR